MQEIGETRDSMARGCIQLVEDFAEKMRHESRPFYIVFFAKPDAQLNAIRQVVKAYYSKPPKILGILVWYVNNALGQFEFIINLRSSDGIMCIWQIEEELGQLPGRY